MKKIISMALALAMVAGMAPVFSISASETPAETPEITVDGDVSDWEGLNSLEVVGTDDYEGKSATFYGVVTEEGLYLAVEAYHNVYTTTANTWFDNTNFEFFVNRSNDGGNQGYVSAWNFPENQAPTLSHPSQMAGNVVMITEELQDQATSYHSVVEVFLPMSFRFDGAKPETSIEALTTGGVTRVGMAWKTPGDDINNGGTNAVDNWWAPAGTHPNNTANMRPVVTAEGVFTIGSYRTATRKDYIERGSDWNYVTGTGTDVPAPEGWPNTADFGTSGAAPFGNRADGAHNTWGTNDNPADGTQANAWLYVAKEFTVEDLEAIAGNSLYTEMFYDDDIKLYVNGVLVYDHSDWNEGYTKYCLAVDAADVLVEGTNVISASLHQHTGGYEFDLNLYSEPLVVENSIIMPKYAYASTADQLINYITYANYVTGRSENVTRVTSLTLTEDIDVSEATTTWRPLTRYIGTFDGNGHTISNITYKNTAASGNFGLIVNNLANNNANGVVQNLTIKDSVIVASSTDSVGGIVGNADRGRVLNCTLDNVYVIGGRQVGGIAGGANYASDGDVIRIADNTVKNSMVIATQRHDSRAGGLVGWFGGGDGCELDLGNYTVENVGLQANTTRATLPDNNGVREGENATSSGVVDLLIGYVQCREGSTEGTYDMRFLVEGYDDFLKDCKDATMTVVYTKKGETDTTTTMSYTMDKAYKTIRALEEDVPAQEGYSFVGMVVPGIGVDDVQSVSASVTFTSETGESLTIGLGSVDNLPVYE